MSLTPYQQLLSEIRRLNEGYERLSKATDPEMRHGDLAREIASEMLTPPTEKETPCPPNQP